jgi:hypothetical protein
MSIYKLTKEEQRIVDINLCKHFNIEYTLKEYGDIYFECLSQPIEPWNKGKKGLQVPWNKGIKGTSGNQKKSEEMKKRISKTLMGHPVSEETRRKMSLKKIGKNPPNKGKKYTIVVCPHCKKQGAQPLMKRYHFDNCYKFGR